MHAEKVPPLAVGPAFANDGGVRRWMQICAFFGIAAASAAAGCVLGGPEDPGCSEDAECGEGFACRAGACFRESTGGAFVGVDAGDAGDASDAD